MIRSREGSATETPRASCNGVPNGLPMIDFDVLTHSSRETRRESLTGRVPALSHAATAARSEAQPLPIVPRQTGTRISAPKRCLPSASWPRRGPARRPQPPLPHCAP